MANFEPLDSLFFLKTKSEGLMQEEVSDALATIV
jgi:hypothetical protein